MDLALAVVCSSRSSRSSSLPNLVSKALVCLLLAFPYLVLRFTAALGLISSSLVRWPRPRAKRAQHRAGWGPAVEEVGSLHS
jgi:hypothetical protein